jgi:hypothetical protein
MNLQQLLYIDLVRVSMSYLVETQPSVPPVVISVLNADFNPAAELGPALEEIDAAFAAMSEPFYYVSDTHNAHWNFAEMVQAMAASAGHDVRFMKNPYLKEIVVVTDSSLIKMGVSALGQEQYGMVRASTAPTLEAAFEYIHSATGVGA